MKEVTEIVTFRLNAGVDPAAFAKSAEAIAPFLERMGGMVRRTLSCDPDGLWTDHIIWSSQAQADAAGKAVMEAPEASAMMQAIDPGSAKMRHATIHLQQE